MEIKRDKELSNLLNNQIEEVSKSIDNIEKYMANGDTAKAFSSLRMIAPTDSMKIFGARLLNKISELILEDEDYEVTADDFYIIYQTEKFALRYPIINNVKTIEIFSKEINNIEPVKREIEEEGTHKDNVLMLKKLENYKEDPSYDNLTDYLSVTGEHEISRTEFIMNKNKYNGLVDDETLKAHRNLVEKGEQVFEKYDSVIREQEGVLERAEEYLADFLELGYRVIIVEN